MKGGERPQEQGGEGVKAWTAGCAWERGTGAESASGQRRRAGYWGADSARQEKKAQGKKRVNNKRGGGDRGGKRRGHRPQN